MENRLFPVKFKYCNDIFPSDHYGLKCVFLQHTFHIVSSSTVSSTENYKNNNITFQGLLAKRALLNMDSFLCLRNVAKMAKIQINGYSDIR